MSLGNDPNELLLKAVDLLNKANLRYGLYGGLALAVYGTPRETVDVDLAVSPSMHDVALAAIEKLHGGAIVAFREVPFGGLLISRVTFLFDKGRDRTTANTVDLVSPQDLAYYGRIQERAIAGQMRGEDVVVVAPEDFVILKVLSTRERDLEDAASVVVRLREEDAIDMDLVAKEIEALSVGSQRANVVDRWERLKILFGTAHPLPGL